jgi:hypothetical protein
MSIWEFSYVITINDREGSPRVERGPLYRNEGKRDHAPLMGLGRGQHKAHSLFFLTINT